MNRSISVILLTVLFGAGSVIVNADAGIRSVSPSAYRSMQLSQILFPQHNRHGRWRNNGNVRYETRTVRKGHKVYEDTYRITYKNGHEKRKRVERVRIR